MISFHLSPPDESQLRALAEALDDDARRVLLAHGTEAPFCGAFLDNKRDGTYTCGLCGLPLFRSRAKFDSGTGWPSFFEPIDPGHIRYVRDLSHGMVRVEEVCARCGSHLGHVFPDRSEEHTSELQSRENLVCRLLLEKTKERVKPTN